MIAIKRAFHIEEEKCGFFVSFQIGDFAERKKKRTEENKNN